MRTSLFCAFLSARLENVPFPDAAAAAGRFCSETDKLSKRKFSSFGDGGSVWLCFGGSGVDYDDFCSADRI